MNFYVIYVPMCFIKILETHRHIGVPEIRLVLQIIYVSMYQKEKLVCLNYALKQKTLIF